MEYIDTLLSNLASLPIIALIFCSIAGMFWYSFTIERKIRNKNKKRFK